MTATGVRIADMPDLGAVTDGASVVGELAGSGRFGATALRDYMGANLGATYATIASTTAADNLRLLKSGDTMTGGLHLKDWYVTGASPGQTLSFAGGNGNFSGSSCQLTDNTTGAAFQASITGTTMTVTAVTRGTIAANQYVTYGIAYVTILITGQLTGTPGGVGTYSLASSGSQVSAPLQSYTYATSFSAVGTLNRAGGAIFGLYAEARLNTNGGASNELDSFNMTGVNPPGQYPPNINFGTPDAIAITLQLVAGGNAQSQIALSISQGPVSHQCGVYMWPGANSNYGLFIDASATVSALQPALIRSNQTQTAMTLQIMGAPSAGTAVLNVENAAGTSIASIQANGNIGNAGVTLGSNGIVYYTTANLTASATAGAASALPATPAGYMTTLINGSTARIPFYN